MPSTFYYLAKNCVYALSNIKLWCILFSWVFVSFCFENRPVCDEHAEEIIQISAMKKNVPICYFALPIFHWFSIMQRAVWLLDVLIGSICGLETRIKFCANNLHELNCATVMTTMKTRNRTQNPEMHTGKRESDGRREIKWCGCQIKNTTEKYTIYQSQSKC